MKLVENLIMYKLDFTDGSRYDDIIVLIYMLPFKINCCIFLKMSSESFTVFHKQNHATHDAVITLLTAVLVTAITLHAGAMTQKMTLINT